MKIVRLLGFIVLSFVLAIFWAHMIYLAVRGLPVPAFYDSAWFRVFEMYLLAQGLAASVASIVPRD